MKRFEMKSKDSEKDSISMIDANIGDIMYIRQDGKVVAVKILSVMVSANSDGDLVGDVLLLDAERGRKQYKSIYDKSIYRSVEDCRKKENEIPGIELDPQFVANSVGLDVVKWRGGLPVFCFYKWDGFYPRKVEVGMREMEFTFDGDSWKCDTIGRHEYYRTFEECESDNHVEVILFP